MRIFIIYISFRKIALNNPYNGNDFLKLFLNISYYILNIYYNIYPI